jgi:uncharacterized heparinase superfamily protein
MSVAQWLHTVRFLRSRQIAGQVRERVRRVAENPAAFRPRPVPEAAPVRWRPRTAFLPFGPQSHEPSRMRSGEFTFLNRSDHLGWPPRWDAEELPALHRYNLHYFDFLWALDYEDGRALVQNWIAEHRLARGRIGWDAYPTSLRLVNWCAYFHGRHHERTAADTEFAGDLWRSLYRQAEWLRGHLETHLLGNHLLENAVALAFCGACFDGPAAERWARCGAALLEEQLPEQVLADGGHFEHSPMYHLRVAYALTALLDTGAEWVTRLVDEPLARMMSALPRLVHPDREIALFNDSATGVANTPDELRAWWSRVSGHPARESDAEPGAFALGEMGYYGARSDPGHYVVCDAGPLGPEYLMGHAHGGLFSFELSLHGQRVIVDSGVHGYEPDELRRYCRSTRAHNTVEVEGESQCEFWAAFRVARRARPRDVAFETLDDGFRLSGWHDGYERLPGRPRHRRSFQWQDGGVLSVEDTVTSGRPVQVTSRLHLHPSCEIDRLEGTTAGVRHPRGSFRVSFRGDGELIAEDSIYCPEFGRVLDNRALAFSASGSRIELGFRVEDGSP